MRNTAIMSYSPQVLRQKLARLNSTQQSIQTLSHWIIYHSKHASESVSVWQAELEAASNYQRQLVLFFLANDVIQTSKRRGVQFLEPFSHILPSKVAETVASFKSQNAQDALRSLQRIVRIWKERNIYDTEFMNKLLTSAGENDEKLPTTRTSTPTTHLPESKMMTASSSILDSNIFRCLEKLERESVTVDLLAERVSATTSTQQRQPLLIDLKKSLEEDLETRNELVNALSALISAQEATMQKHAKLLSDTLSDMESYGAGNVQSHDERNVKRPKVDAT